MTPVEIVKKLAETNEEMKAINKEKSKLQVDINALKTSLLKQITVKTDLIYEGVKYKKVIGAEAKIINKDLLYKFIIKHEVPWLLQNILSEKVYSELLDEFSGVPGIQITRVSKLSIKRAA